MSAASSLLSSTTRTVWFAGISLEPRSWKGSGNFLAYDRSVVTLPQREENPRNQRANPTGEFVAEVLLAQPARVGYMSADATGPEKQRGGIVRNNPARIGRAGAVPLVRWFHLLFAGGDPHRTQGVWGHGGGRGFDAGGNALVESDWCRVAGINVVECVRRLDAAEPVHPRDIAGDLAGGSRN